MLEIVMKNRSLRRNAYTAVELLIVVLILGFLVALAIPSYASSIGKSRHDVANSNARSIVTAIQSIYVKNGGYRYNTVDQTAIAKEFGGSLPSNPCTGGSAFGRDYRLSLTRSSATVEALPGKICKDGALPKFTLRQA